MASLLAALLSGALLGGGLVLSDMINPARVLAFLDVAGAWDATLLFVMGGAVAAASTGYVAARGMPRPLLASRFHIPENRALDARLMLGSALFGIGWGLVGLCPVLPSPHSHSGCGRRGCSFSRCSPACCCIALLWTGEPRTGLDSSDRWLTVRGLVTTGGLEIRTRQSRRRGQWALRLERSRGPAVSKDRNAGRTRTPRALSFDRASEEAIAALGNESDYQ